MQIFDLIARIHLLGRISELAKNGCENVEVFFEEIRHIIEIRDSFQNCLV